MQEENVSRFQKFENWLTNMFWFHYKWYFLLGVFVFTLLILAAISALTTANYDRSVVFAHTGQKDAELVRKVGDYITQELSDYSDGEIRKVAVYEIPGAEIEAAQNGQKNFYTALTDSDYILMLVDQEIFELYSGLGYFEQLPDSPQGEKSVLIESLGLYAVVNNGPIDKISLDELSDDSITQEDVDEVNAELQSEHDALVDEVLVFLKSLDS